MSRAAGSTSRWINLLLPGGGLILLGHSASGLLLGLLFTLAANFAIAGRFIVPDDVPASVQVLALILTAAIYGLAQLFFARALRRAGQARRTDVRRTALRRVQEALAAGQPHEAWDAIQPLVPSAENDLLVALRLAQVLSEGNDMPAACAAWRRVARLDRHRVYRTEIQRYQSALERQIPSAEP